MIILTETSPATKDYNCIAWAAEDDTKRWDIDPYGIYYWPPAVPRRRSIEEVTSVFESIGYETCNDESVEPGFKKIAIYADSSDLPTHVARQLPNGKWTSKLGDFEDVEHQFIHAWERALMQMRTFELSSYGKLVKIMKKTF